MAAEQLVVRDCQASDILPIPTVKVDAPAKNVRRFNHRCPVVALYTSVEYQVSDGTLSCLQGKNCEYHLLAVATANYPGMD